LTHAAHLARLGQSACTDRAGVQPERGYIQKPIDRETFVGEIERFLPDWFAQWHATPEAQ